MSVPEAHLSGELSALIAKHLFMPEYLELLVSEVHEELERMWKSQQTMAGREALPELERQRYDLELKINALIDEIEAGSSAALKSRLEQREFQLSRV